MNYLINRLCFSALFVAMLFFFSLTGVQAQSGKTSTLPKDDVSNEGKLKTFIISTLLFELRAFTDDVDEYDDFLTTDGIFQKTFDEFFAASPDHKQLFDVPKLPPTERAAKVDKVISAFKGKLDSSELWQFELGKSFAAIAVELIKVSSSKSSLSSRYDENKLKQNLSKIKELSASPPAGFPREVLVKFDYLAKVNTGKKTMAAKDYQSLVSRVGDLFEVIKPGSTK